MFWSVLVFQHCNVETIVTYLVAVQTLAYWKERQLLLSSWVDNGQLKNYFDVLKMLGSIREIRDASRGVSRALAVEGAWSVDPKKFWTTPFKLSQMRGSAHFEKLRGLESPFPLGCAIGCELSELQFSHCRETKCPSVLVMGHLMGLYVQKERVDNISLINIKN